MKIGIGTAQWGGAYGVSNTQGPPSKLEIQRILSLAQGEGLKIIDTASQYGASEERLGESLPKTHSFQIVTKTSDVSRRGLTAADAARIQETVAQSLRRLGQESIYGLLIHHAEELISDSSGLLWKTLQSMRAQGLVQKIGVSVYTGSEIDFILDHALPDMIQLPFNVFDQRLLRSGHLAMLKQAGIEIHARSVFLQGLLLMNLRDVPDYFAPWRPSLERYHAALQRSGMNLLQGALQFVLQQPEIDCVLVGIPTHTQLSEIIQTIKSLPGKAPDLDSMSILDEKLLNPSQWNLGQHLNI